MALDFHRDLTPSTSHASRHTALVTYSSSAAPNSWTPTGVYVATKIGANWKLEFTSFGFSDGGYDPSRDSTRFICARTTLRECKRYAGYVHESRKGIHV